MPMNWNLVQDIESDIALASITDDDSRRFPNGATGKAFLLLQLGVERPTHLERPLPTQPDSSDLS
jgi:hypothetical protein